MCAHVDDVAGMRYVDTKLLFVYNIYIHKRRLVLLQLYNASTAMTPAQTITMTLFDLPWQNASYILICICSIVWLAKQLRCMLSLLLSVIGYVFACTLGYGAFVMMRWSVSNGVTIESIKAFSDVVIANILTNWTNTTTQTE